MAISSRQRPHRVKYLEALGAVADDRVDVNPRGATVQSSSRNKSYEVEVDFERGVASSNDNGSYYRGYVGYPLIATLVVLGKIPVPESSIAAFRDIPWKDMNTELRNDYDRLFGLLRDREQSTALELDELAAAMEQALLSQQLQLVRSAKPPPPGY